MLLRLSLLFVLGSCTRLAAAGVPAGESAANAQPTNAVEAFAKGVPIKLPPGVDDVKWLVGYWTCNDRKIRQPVSSVHIHPYLRRMDFLPDLCFFRTNRPGASDLTARTAFLPNGHSLEKYEELVRLNFESGSSYLWLPHPDEFTIKRDPAADPQWFTLKHTVTGDVLLFQRTDGQGVEAERQANLMKRLNEVRQRVAQMPPDSLAWVVGLWKQTKKEQRGNIATGLEEMKELRIFPYRDFTMAPGTNYAKFVGELRPMLLPLPPGRESFCYMFLTGTHWKALAMSTEAFTYSHGTNGGREWLEWVRERGPEFLRIRFEKESENPGEPLQWNAEGQHSSFRDWRLYERAYGEWKGWVKPSDEVQVRVLDD